MLARLSRILFALYRPFYILQVGVSTALFTTAAIITTLFTSSGNPSHYVAWAWSRFNLFLGGTTLHTHGVGWIQPGQSYIVMSNHQSHYDIWAVFGAIPLQVRWVMKMELRKIPIFGFGCARAGHIYVDRGKSQQAKRSMEAAGEQIRAGASVAFFPEGRRSGDGVLQPFKKGGFHVARAARVPILPVSINGSRHALPKGRWWKVRPGVVNIVYHQPIRIEDYDDQPLEVLMADVRAAIASGMAD